MAFENVRTSVVTTWRNPDTGTQYGRNRCRAFS